MTNLGNGFCTVHVNLSHFEVPRVPPAPSAVDDHVAVLNDASNGLLVPDVPRHWNNLANVSHHLQRVDAALLAAIRDYNLRAMATQLIHDVLAQESSTAKDSGNDTRNGLAPSCEVEVVSRNNHVVSN